MGWGRLDWDRLQVFQTVADVGTIKGAAKTLSRSYGKVSSDLEELERALGHQLFERSNRGLELTTVGQEVLRSARNMSDTVQSIIGRTTDRSRDKLVICAREGIATYWLARHLPELLDIDPDVQVFLKVMPRTPSLIGGEADIAIQYEMPTDADIISRQLGWLHYLLYASPDYLAHHGEPKELSDLQQHQILRLHGEEYQPERWRTTASAWRTILPDTLTTDASTVMVEACAAGAGIAAMPSYVSACEPRLKPLLTIKPLSTVKFWLAYTERVRDLKASEPVLRWIRSCFDPQRYECFREVFVPPISNDGGGKDDPRSML